MTLLDIIGRDVKLKRAASTGGGEYHGPCPVCGGNDRFRVQPEKGRTGKFACRKCGIGGDGIDYLRNVKGLTFQEACKELDYTPPENTTRAILNRHIDGAWRQEIPLEQRKPIKAGDYEKRKAEMLKVQAEPAEDIPETEPDIAPENDPYEHIRVTIHERSNAQPEVIADNGYKAITQWKGAMEHINRLGCPECKHLHGQSCAGGPYPRLVGMLEACPMARSTAESEA